MQRRKQSRRHTRKHRDEHSEAEYDEVHAHAVQQRKGGALKTRDSEGAGQRQRRADRRSAAAENQRVHQQLPNETEPRRAERGAHGHLAPARGRAREQQIGHVRAHQQHQERDGARENEEARFEASAHVLTKGAEPRRESIDGAAVYMVVLVSRADQRGFRLRGLHRDAVPQPADQRERVSLSVRLGTEWKRKEDVGAPTRRERRREIERLREHAHDRHGMPVEHDGAADDGEVTREAAPPELVAEDYGFGSVPAALWVVEEAPDYRLYAKHGKEILRYGDAGKAFRLAAPRETDIARSVEREHAGNTGPRAALPAEREQIVHLHRLTGEVFRRAVGDPDQPFGPFEWKRTEQQGAAKAEHSGAGADSDRNHGDHEHRGGRVAPEGSGAEANVLRDGVGECHRRLRHLPLKYGWSARTDPG